ncbi:hypothetical protein GLOIN_2v1762218 [Rhizophagus irregularis DAOM 181602=DAOM 197198]|nr:hypothetical protein GLOIN_2v1762218 [Rhizophagus irregularis DAOM 181602=DAOM 197198]
MSFEYFQELSNDLEKLLTTEKGYDVIIYVGENENIKEFHAHSSILCTRSQYFCSAFSNEWANKKDEKFIFKKPNISPELFKIILRYIYCGKIDLTKLQGPEVLKLLIVVDELNIQSLISCIQKYLIKNEDKLKLLQQNPIEILETVYQHESFTDLWNYFLEKICEDPETLFNSNKFTNLKAPLLKLLLNRDDLDLEEIIIWDNLLKWGLAQNPSISQDLTKWSKEDIIIMERSLHGFVPLVRFYHISSDDFIEKVYPLKKLLPEDLVDDLVKFHITPNKKLTNDKIGLPRQSKFIYDSTLIERQHFAILANVKNIVTAKVSYSNGNEYSIFNRLNYGPIFGGGYDLVYCGDGIMCCYRGSQSSYSEIDGMPRGRFNVNDYEVFQVIRKQYFLECIYN